MNFFFSGLKGGEWKPDGDSPPFFEWRLLHQNNQPKTASPFTPSRDHLQSLRCHYLNTVYTDDDAAYPFLLVLKKNTHIVARSAGGKKKNCPPPSSTPPTPSHPKQKSLYACRGKREERERIKKFKRKLFAIQSNFPKYARNYQLIAAWKPEPPSLLSFFSLSIYLTNLASFSPPSPPPLS